MILHPTIIALMMSSLLMTLLALYASSYGIRIIRHWDITSGSSLQLELERRTYFISTVLAAVFCFQLISLFLFIYTADSLCNLFSGAMCAVGTLNVNQFGYPVLSLKVLNFILAGIWLIVNYTDNRGYDYPLIRKKYALLLLLAPLIAAEAVLQTLYFFNLHPDIITSCCGSLFSKGQNTVSDIAAFPVPFMKILFSLTMTATLGMGAVFYKRGIGGYVLAVLSGSEFFIALAALLSFISLYVYELPTHHCPFCLLQKEYGYVGYLLYGTLLGGAVSGMGVGVLMPFRQVSSLAAVIPAQQKNLARFSFLAYALFTMMTIYLIVRSHLVL